MMFAQASLFAQKWHQWMLFNRTHEHESNLSDCLQNYYLLLFNQVLSRESLNVFKREWRDINLN